MPISRRFATVILSLLALLMIYASSPVFGEAPTGGGQATEQTRPAPSFADLDYAQADPGQAMDTSWTSMSPRALVRSCRS